jgi:hypothetical protein
VEASGALVYGCREGRETDLFEQVLDEAHGEFGNLRNLVSRVLWFRIRSDVCTRNREA